MRHAPKIHYGGGVRIVSDGTVSVRKPGHPACQMPRSLTPPRMTSHLGEVTCQHCIAVIKGVISTSMRMKEDRE